MSGLPPIQPLEPLLPFNREGFDFRAFERFCLLWIKAQPDVADAQPHGRPGDRQDGIDIVAELHDGRERSYQCRKVEQFGPKAAEKTIAEDVYGAAEHVVVTACAVSPRTRRVVRAAPNWKIQDVEDVCASLRVEIAPEAARRIVDATFGPAVRKAFLGGSSTNLFVEPEEFFVPFTDRGRLFRHTWDLVGRADELAELRRAVEDGGVTVLSGRGGIGKTRLLRALVAEMPQTRFLFAADKDTPIGSEELDELPLEDIVVIIDDAHQRSPSDIAPLLRLSSRRPQPIRVVLVTRPHGVERLGNTAVSAGHAAADVTVLTALGDLARPAVVELARQALGDDHQWAEELASATADCPLVTVVGGQLLASRHVSPSLLEREAEFREEVLGRWQDELVGTVNSEFAPGLVRDAMKLLAAVAPVSVEDERLLAVLAGWLEVTVPVLRDLISALESAGVVVARGRLRRITPDVLADHVLHRACIDQQGRPNGFADELFLRLAPVGFERLLRNLAELDWRVTQTSGAVALLDEIWKTLTSTFRAGSAGTRISLLEMIRPVAAYQPLAVIEICRIAVSEPVPATEPAPWPLPSDATVREELSAVLRGVGLHAELAPEVFGLLWSLGRDHRESNPGPEHPIRVIRELGGWRHGHPDLLLAFVRQLISERDEDAAWHPLELLEDVVGREGSNVVSFGIHWEFSPWFLNVGPTAALRDELFDLVASELTKDDRTGTRAADLLSKAMAPLRGMSGARPDDEAREQWRDEQISLLDRIAERWPNCSAMVRARLVHDLKWHVAHGSFEEEREKASRLVDAEQDLEVRLVEALAWPFDLRDLSENGFDRPSAAVHALGSDAAALGSQLPRTLNDLIGRLDAIDNLDAHPDELLHVLASDHGRLAGDTATWALEHTDEPLARYVPGLMGLLQSADPEFVDRTVAGLDSADPVHRRVLAMRLSSSDLDPAELAPLLADEDFDVRVTALHRLIRAEPTEPLIELALEYELATPHEERLVSHYLKMIVPNMAEAQLAKAAARVAERPKLDWAWRELVSEIGARDHELALKTLTNRVRHASDTKYDAIPYERFDTDPLRGASEQQLIEALEAVRDLVAETDGIVRQEAVALFWLLDRDLDLQLSVVEEWMSSDDQSELDTACRLLSRIDYGSGRRGGREESWQLLLARPWFAVSVSSRPGRSAESSERCVAALITAIEGFSSGRQLGNASPRAVKTAEVAGKMVGFLPPGPARDFYATMLRRAEEEMESDALDDEELEDRWRG